MFRKRNLLSLKFRNCLNFFQNFSEDAATVETKFNNGRNMLLSTGKYARFANASTICEMGDTSVMVTAVSSKQKTTNSFTPLTIDYRLKSAAAGRIPTNYFRRELGSSEKEILTARLVDRSIRPLFSSDFKYETQIVCSVLAMDSIFLPDILAINAASTALSLSDIPWNGPIGAVRVGLCDDEVLINPSRRELQSSILDLVVTATKQNLVIMLEGKGDVVSINDMAKAIRVGVQQAQLVITSIENLQKTAGKPKQVEDLPEINEAVLEAVTSMSEMRLREVFQDETHDKTSRDVAVNQIKSDVLNRVWSNFPNEDPIKIGNVFGKVCKQTFRNAIFEGKRCDGRSVDDLRKISCQIDLHKPLHGSALFQRGQTQVLCTVALDSLESALKLDSLTSIDTGVKSKNFMLHYEFPPYATGEIGRVGSVGRREIGHGALAEKALVPVIPSDFPFTIRLTSEVLESNGSSSMASVCGGSLALMDSGVPVSGAVAGVAVGLVTKYDIDDFKQLLDYRLLTDISGIEDYMGDMDMKVAGTKQGFTAIQLDLKIPGIPLKVVVEALQKGTQAKSKVLEIMNQCIREYRKVRKQSWPVTEKIELGLTQRSALFGHGGINAKKLHVEIGVHITQDENSCITLFAPSQTALDEAKEFISKLSEKTPDLEFGGIYNAKIVEIRDMGVMVTLYPNMPPILLHNSQLDQKKVAHASALNLEVGQEIQVKYFGRDPVTGFMRISRKVLQGPTAPFIKNLDKTS
ncbi:polyribonucleotide nucleotidyltransferase 1, mitochondrial [Condylostylus longicornis]|uniref:polyribonucleotide nucleotidyltransferase 1, mitochondrial n=1 Tax=Condylostylus longicornis TaxID=2530218 RepID=UPI00244DAF79|nr:polyribonucleotide nucleotidyltransferase 1, mitochondrial [Condylostylus longicornis]